MGSATGGAVVCLVLFVFSGLALPLAGPAGAAVGPGAAAPVAPLMPAYGPALAAGGGVLAAAIVAWAIARPLDSLFLRAALAMMAVMGTALVAAATMPAHMYFGRAGLAVLAALCLAAIVVARRAFLGATPLPPE